MWPVLTSTCTQHYYRHSIVLVIGFRYSIQACHFTTPFMPHMTLLGFMCPGLGKSIRSWVLSHHAINKPHDMSPLSYSLSPDQPHLLYTPLVFATYHAIYGTCTATSTPIIAFVLISPVHTDNKGWQNTPHPYTSHFAPLPNTCTCTLPHTLHLHFAPCLHLHLAPFAPLPVHIPS